MVGADLRDRRISAPMRARSRPASTGGPERSSVLVFGSVVTGVAGDAVGATIATGPGVAVGATGALVGAVVGVGVGVPGAGVAGVAVDDTGVGRSRTSGTTGTTAAHVDFVTTVSLKGIAPVWAIALPARVAPPPTKLIEVEAKTVPTIVVVPLNVAEESTFQKTLQA